jgi:hypothetical protein
MDDDSSEYDSSNLYYPSDEEEQLKRGLIPVGGIIRALKAANLPNKNILNYFIDITSDDYDDGMINRIAEVILSTGKFNLSIEDLENF